MTGTIAYVNYQAGRALSIAFVCKGDNVTVVPTWWRLCIECGLEDFSLFCRGTADGDGDDGAFICCSFHGKMSSTCLQISHSTITLWH